MVKETIEYSFNNVTKTCKVITPFGTMEFYGDQGVKMYKFICDKYERDTSEDGGEQQMRSQIS